MKKIVVLSLILCSCKTQEIIQQDKFVVVSWEKNNETFDVYKSDSLIAQKIPCDGFNKVTLHNYNQGDYKFVFKTNDVVVEEKSIRINK